MNLLLVLPFALPLAAAGSNLLARRHLGIQRVTTAVMLVALLATGGALIAATRDGAAVATRIGDWPSGLAIPFAADGLSALMIATTTGMASLALVFAAARGEDRHQLFHPMVAVLLAGVLGSFVTADLFNLFVTFEVMLIASYVLLTLRGGRRQIRAGTVYVGVNLLASSILLIGIGLVYGAAGTVNFAQLVGISSAVPTAGVGAAIVLVAVAIKASLVPMHGWLPRAYVEAGPAVTAIFSGLLTKAGVYVLFRLSSVLFAGDTTWHPVFLAVAGLTMVVGVLGAVGSTDIRGILAFHMVSQVGYLILPLGLWSVVGVTAGLVYLIQYVFVKGALFVAAGAVETLTGTGQLSQLGGMVRTRPWLAIAFLLPALSLAGIPPTSGFVGKFLLVRAAFEGQHWLAGGVAVLVSLFTLLSMVKIWNGVFWGEPSTTVLREPAAATAGIPVPATATGMPAGASSTGDTTPAPVPTPAGSADGTTPDAVPSPAGRAGTTTPDAVPTPAGSAGDATWAGPPPPRVTAWRVPGMVGPALLVGLLTIVVGVSAQPLVELVEPAARALIDPTVYLEAVRSA